MQTRFNSKHLNSGLADSVLEQLRRPPPGFEDCKEVFVTLDMKVDRYGKEYPELPGEDPLGVKKEASLLQKPFALYGATVALSNQDRLDYYENYSIKYLKDVCYNLLESNQQLRNEVEAVKTLNSLKNQEVK